VSFRRELVRNELEAAFHAGEYAFGAMCEVLRGVPGHGGAEAGAPVAAEATRTVDDADGEAIAVAFGDFVHLVIDVHRRDEREGIPAAFEPLLAEGIDDGRECGLANDAAGDEAAAEAELAGLLVVVDGALLLGRGVYQAAE